MRSTWIPGGLPLHAFFGWVVGALVLVAGAPPGWGQGAAGTRSDGVVRLNEVMASNGVTMADEDGDYSDWIELVNIGSEPLALGGFGLSDNLGQPFRWVFPEVWIAPGEFLLVWASGKNRAVAGMPLHTNFSISQAGEAIVLTAPDGSRVDELGPRAIPRDVSVGRQPDGAGAWLYFYDPTPGASNDGQGFAALLDPPDFSHAGGWHPAAFELHLATADPAAMILYTLDGSEPDPLNLAGSGPEYQVDYFFPGFSSQHVLVPRRNHTFTYTGPISILPASLLANDLSEIITTYRNAPSYWWRRPSTQGFRGTVVRARICKDGYCGSTTTHTYLIHPLGSARYTLPVVALSTNPEHFFGYAQGFYVEGAHYFAGGGTEFLWAAHGNYFQDWEKPAHVELYEADGTHAFSQNLGLKIHGGGGRTIPDKSFRVYARNAYDASDTVHYEFFPGATKPGSAEPVNEFRRFLLRTAGNVRNHLRDVPAHLVMAPLQVGTQRSRPLIQFVNGEYWGITYARDRFDEYHLAHHYNLDPENVIVLDAPWGIIDASKVEAGLPTDIVHYNHLYQFAVQQDLGVPTNYEYVTTLLDIDSYIDFNVAFIFMNNYDWYGSKHFRYWRVRETSPAPYQDGRWRILVWDFDTSPYVPTYDLLRNALHPTGGGDNLAFGSPSRTALLRALLTNSSFRQRFINRFADHMNTTFQPARITAIVQEQYALLAPELLEYRQRWRRDATTLDTVTLWVDFAENRAFHQRDHLRTHLNVGADVTVTVDVSNPAHGHVRVNTVEIVPTTAGVGAQPYPWTGVYFDAVPIELTALPAPDHVFAGWEGLPPGTPASVTLSVTEPLSVVALFEPTTPRALVHYWNFNHVPTLLDPTHTVGGAHLTINPGPLTVVLDGNGNGFWGENARQGDAPGTHLRVNNPLGATVTFALPTTGFEDIIVQYETRRSGQGAGRQQVSYTTNGVDYLPLVELVVQDDDPILYAFDFTGIAAVAENPDFALRILFEQGAGSTVGNNRFDNLTLDGRPTGSLNAPPLIVAVPPLQEVVEAADPVLINLADVFSDPDADPLTYGFQVARPWVASATVVGSILTLTPQARGDTHITITADDGHNPAVATSFRVLVYPEAHVLATGAYEFGAWDPDMPEYAYPAHMLFLQSDRTDPVLNTPLLYPYYIPHDDYHDDDLGTLGFPYNNTRRTRLNGLGPAGISFINTGFDRDLGGALLAVNTVGLEEVPVAWVAGTVLRNSRLYALRLQYRVGSTGPFVDVLADGQPVEYLAGADGDVQGSGPVTLPGAALDQPYVQLLWRYYHVSGSSGPRAELRLDDLRVGFSAPPGLGDFNGDGVIDFADFEIFVIYMSGPDVLYDPQNLPPEGPLVPDADGYLACDFDRDGDVDKHDLAIFKRQMVP